MPPRGIPSPAEFLEISNRLNDLPSWIGTGPRFTMIVPFPGFVGGRGKTKPDGGLTTLGAFHGDQGPPGCHAQPVGK